MTTQKNAKEIVKETVEYYKTHRRAVDPDGICYYLSPDGARCAVGRCMMDGVLFLCSGLHGKMHIKSATCPASDIKDLDSYLKEEYRGRGIDFWCNLQALHDTADFWQGACREKTENKLTPEGIAFCKYTLGVDVTSYV